MNFRNLDISLNTQIKLISFKGKYTKFDCVNVANSHKTTSYLLGSEFLKLFE